MTETNDDDLLPPEAVVKHFAGGVGSTATLANWRYRGKGPKYVKIGRSVLYRRGDIAKYLAKQTRDPEAA